MYLSSKFQSISTIFKRNIELYDVLGLMFNFAVVEVDTVDFQFTDVKINIILMTFIKVNKFRKSVNLIHI